jgi:DNA-binding transcriptional MocR family regulator
MWAPNLSDTGKPKYQAIADALEEDIRTGRLLPGDKLPPQRELADLLRINVSTVSRACREVERRGLIGGRRLPNSLPATDCC